jgi:hypothetical protein
MRKEARKKLLNKIKAKPLSNFDLIRLARKLGVNNFRGVFSRDALPQKPNPVECGVINLSGTAPGTHWVCYIASKPLDICVFYNSYGDLKPPRSLYKYFKSYSNIYFNMRRDQVNYGPAPSLICGHLCLLFFVNMSRLLENK